jgi:hypothetical protein
LLRKQNIVCCFSFEMACLRFPLVDCFALILQVGLVGVDSYLWHKVWTINTIPAAIDANMNAVESVSV